MQLLSVGNCIHSFIKFKLLLLLDFCHNMVIGISSVICSGKDIFMTDRNDHMSLSDRQIIETGITNGSSKKSIADTIGKNKSTISREIKNHRTLKRYCSYPIDCSLYQKCKIKKTSLCSKNCKDYKKFYCSRRDRSPGACNGCSSNKTCHFDKYYYRADSAYLEYRDDLVNCRAGVNATREEISNLGNLIKPLLDKGQSLYAIKQGHPEIKVTEQTLYNYIENGVFQDAGVSITCMDLKKQVSRKPTKKQKNQYSPRKDRTYLKGRTYADYKEYCEANPYARIVEMDTVYNDITNGPFLQTFKFLSYDLLICFYHTEKTSAEMLKGILYLEEILGKDIFEHEVEVLKTDRGSEFVLAEESETRDDGTRRTRLFYCDAMASYQKGSLENVHHLVRDICPKNCDLKELGLDSQKKADLISIHINSYPKEKLKGKTSFQLLEFYNPDMTTSLKKYGLIPINSDDVILKPYLLKQG